MSLPFVLEDEFKPVSFDPAPPQLLDDQHLFASCGIDISLSSAPGTDDLVHDLDHAFSWMMPVS